ncbi:hypothetical protein PCASD_17523 [Puccinia coronata f. sp. avenae]|uniref:Uncharacterized protein n=1 Tax=Puccinia coronata f. sp. avenae TaxID=200324 RepID=A0A2N5T3U7_9BASI|nr:hypothetical protein PCASD_17523 [Puccinia coronata f. sp. avenae]
MARPHLLLAPPTSLPCYHLHPPAPLPPHSLGCKHAGPWHTLQVCLAKAMTPHPLTNGPNTIQANQHRLRINCCALTPPDLLQSEASEAL